MEKEELKPIYLSEEEIEERLREYISYIKNVYPNLPKIKSAEYKNLKKNAEKGDNEAFAKLEKACLNIAFQYVIYHYLHYDMAGYEFQDTLSDVYLLIKKRMPALLNAPNLSVFRFYSKTTAINNLKRDMRSRASRNLDIGHYLNDEELVDVVESVEDYNAKIDETLLSNNELTKALLKNSLISLSEETCLKMYFGFDELGVKTFDQIGKRYGLSGSRIQQIIANGLSKLNTKRSKRILRDYNNMEL